MDGYISTVWFQLNEVLLLLSISIPTRRPSGLRRGSSDVTRTELSRTVNLQDEPFRVRG